MPSGPSDPGSGRGRHGPRRAGAWGLRRRRRAVPPASRAIARGRGPARGSGRPGGGAAASAGRSPSWPRAHPSQVDTVPGRLPRGFGQRRDGGAVALVRGRDAERPWVARRVHRRMGPGAAPALGAVAARAAAAPAGSSPSEAPPAGLPPRSRSGPGRQVVGHGAPRDPVADHVAQPVGRLAQGTPPRPGTLGRRAQVGASGPAQKCRGSVNRSAPRASPPAPRRATGSRS